MSSTKLGPGGYPVASGVASADAIAGSLDATEGADSAALSGGVLVQGTCSGTDGADTSSLVGSVLVQGTLAGTDGADSVAASGSVIAQGNLAATEGADSADFSGAVVVQATLAATEGADSVAFSGSVVVQGAVSATDAAGAFWWRQPWWRHYRQDAVAPGCEFCLWVEFDPGAANAGAKTKAWRTSRSLALAVGGASGAAWAALVVHAYAIGCEFGWTASWRQSGASGRATVAGSDLVNVLAMAAGGGWGSGHVGGDVVWDAAVQARGAARVYGAAMAHGRECVLLTRLIPGAGMGGRGYDPVVIDNDLLLLCA